MGTAFPDLPPPQCPRLIATPKPARPRPSCPQAPDSPVPARLSLRSAFPERAMGPALAMLRPEASRMHEAKTGWWWPEACACEREVVSAGWAEAHRGCLYPEGSRPLGPCEAPAVTSCLPSQGPASCSRPWGGGPAQTDRQTGTLVPTASWSASPGLRGLSWGRGGLSGLPWGSSGEGEGAHCVQVGALPPASERCPLGEGPWAPAPAGGHPRLEPSLIAQ